MDDGCLYGDLTALAHAFAFLSEQLARVHLKFNTSKCELYMEESRSVPDALIGVPVITDHAKMIYVGAPLHPGTSQAVNAAVSRAATAAQHSTLDKRWAFLRSTVGACRVQYLCQAMHPDDWPADSLASVSNSLGGLGLQIPEDSAAAARLASLVSVADLVDDLGGDHAYMAQALNSALVPTSPSAVLPLRMFRSQNAICKGTSHSRFSPKRPPTSSPLCRQNGNGACSWSRPLTLSNGQWGSTHGQVFPRTNSKVPCAGLRAHLSGPLTTGVHSAGSQRTRWACMQSHAQFRGLERESTTW